jgi:GTPase SAR1 family protein
MNKIFSINNLIEINTLKKCADDAENSLITAVRLVKGYNNSYAQNTEGGITALSLSKSDITALELGATAQDLEYLYLSHNEKLKTLNITAPLPKLTHLHLANCAIEELRIPVGCEALQQLYLSGNGLKHLVFEGNCPNLQLLDLGKNKLESLDLPFAFENLAYLFLKGDYADKTSNDKISNIISNIPKEIWQGKQGANVCEEVKAYLRASQQSGDILNQEAKCIFFGNGRAGKTTLSHQLRKNEFDNTIKLTHGILIKDWEIKQEDFPKNLRKKIKDQIDAYKQKYKRHLDTFLLKKLIVERYFEQKRERRLEYPLSIRLNVWDFGGQEYFHATHRLFLNNNVLYLLVWEESTNQQNEEKGDYPESYWQSNINHYAPKNITLCIQNKEQAKASFDHNKGRYKVANYYQNVQKYKTDIDDLKQGIFERLTQLDYLCTPIPKLYDDIRTEIRNIKAQKPYLLFEEYKLLCQRIDKTEDEIMQNESDIRALTTFLHETGCIICYRYQEKKTDNSLDNYVFINPQWVTETIYKILDEKTLAGKGEFDIKHIANILQENVIPDTSIWLGLMRNFELIFNKKDSEGQFITPQYLPTKCQDLSEKALVNYNEKLPNALILYYPDFLPKSVISRFICYVGNLSKDYYWKYGIVFHKNCEEAYVHCDYNARKITIQTQTILSPLAVEVFNKLRNIDDTESLEIALSHQKDVKNVQHFVNVKRLKERIEKGKSDVEWNKQEFDTEPFKPLFGVERFKKDDNFIDSNQEDMQEIKEQARQLIAKAKTGEAIDLIETWAKYHKAQDILTTITNIKGEWNSLKRKEMIGSISYSNIIEQTASINDRILQLLDLPIPEPKQDDLPRSEQKRILFLGANPFSTGKLNLKEEYAGIAQKLENDANRERLTLKSEFSTTLEDFQVQSESFKPHIIHFAGHGKDEKNEMTDFAKSIGLQDWKKDAGLVFFDTDHKDSIYINGEVLKYNLQSLIDDDGIPVEIVVFNACYSVSQAEVVASLVKYVIGVNNAIKDTASIDFSSGFYRALAEGKDVKAAFKKGKGLAMPKLDNPNQILLYIDNIKQNF